MHGEGGDPSGREGTRSARAECNDSREKERERKKERETEKGRRMKRTREIDRDAS